MKILKLMVAFILLGLLGSLQSYGQESSAEKFKKLQWLVGKWERTNARPGQSGYEEWSKSSSTSLIGKGVTLKGEKTIFVEELELSIQGEDIFYIVKLSDEPKPVLFKLTAITEDTFTCENPEHDFPKKIAYTREGKNVRAIVSGDEQKLVYEFVPFKPQHKLTGSF
jgi:Domain of unknown function (DUF6265)